MSFSITVGSRNITSVGPIKDLKSNIQSDFRLPKELESHLDQPLSALPAELRIAGIDGDAGHSWAPGSFIFTLSAGVKSKLAVMFPGDPPPQLYRRLSDGYRVRPGRPDGSAEGPDHYGTCGTGVCLCRARIPDW
ncbi:MAG: hypothetical protein JO300_14305 [Silvibacterium sp.]|nr:hypothetical protein [Silvibacterium sp.]MBV8438573.1 hypothetical protein [Silvibacterium sp.]